MGFQATDQTRGLAGLPLSAGCDVTGAENRTGRWIATGRSGQAFFTVRSSAVMGGKLVFQRIRMLEARELDRETVIEVGLDHPVGVAGSRLSAAQRQKAALARAILKRPDVLVLSEATSGLDTTSQNRVHAAVMDERKGCGLVWVLHRAALARAFDRVIVLKDGRIAEQGRFEDLCRPGTLLHELMSAE